MTFNYYLKLKLTFSKDLKYVCIISTVKPTNTDTNDEKKKIIIAYINIYLVYRQNFKLTP